MEKIAPPRKVEQVVVGFDGEDVKAPFMLRLGAVLIDYIIFIIAPAVMMVIARFMGNDGNKLLNSPLNSVGWLIAFLLTLTNVVIIPMFGGQSIGKALTGLRIVTLAGEAVPFSRLLIRNLLGYAIVCGSLGLSFLMCVLNRRGRALHDVLAGTVVIYAQKKQAPRAEKE